jgi:hypothetical protein
MMQTESMPPDDCELFLRQLTLVMGSVENASATLDRYLVSILAANAANGSQLGPLMGKLRAAGGELKSFRTTLETRKVVHKLSDAVETMRTHDGDAKDKAKLTPAFNAAAIPRGVSPDFSVDSDGNPSQRKEIYRLLLMKIDVSNFAGKVGVSAVGFVGMGGVGKTSSLICICHDADVKQKFIDGVYFLTLGQDASLRTL